MAFRMRWLGTACFEILLPTHRTIVIDPFLDDSVGAPITAQEIDGCDLICLTHGHYDHILDVGKLVDSFSPEIFCTQVAADSLIAHQGVRADLISVVKPGDVIRRGFVNIEVVPGRHVDFASEYQRITGKDLASAGDDMQAIVESAMMAMLGTKIIPEEFEGWMAKYPQGEQLNFVFDIPGEKRVYMAGSYPAPEVIEVAGRVNADITLLQVLPGRTLRGIEEATAQVALASGCKMVIPQHHDPLLPGAVEADLSRLKEILAEKSDVVFEEWVPGEWHVIGSAGF